MDDRERKREEFLAMARRAGKHLADAPVSMLAVDVYAECVSLAQLAEQRAFNSLVEGSTPSGDTDEPHMLNPRSFVVCGERDGDVQVFCSERCKQRAK
jgi:hypothetical protein